MLVKPGRETVHCSEEVVGFVRAPQDQSGKSVSYVCRRRAMFPCDSPSLFSWKGLSGNRPGSSAVLTIVVETRERLYRFSEYIGSHRALSICVIIVRNQRYSRTPRHVACRAYEPMKSTVGPASRGGPTPCSDLPLSTVFLEAAAAARTAYDMQALVLPSPGAPESSSRQPLASPRRTVRSSSLA